MKTSFRISQPKLVWHYQFRKVVGQILQYFKSFGFTQISMDVSQFCHICKKSHDQMLMLSCVHDVCIDCAAASYAEQIHIKKLNPNVYICEICQEETHLDASSISELKILSKNFVKIAADPRKTSHHKNKVKQLKNTNHSQVKFRQSHSPNKKITYYCKVHSQQEISYYCFGCHQIICPECAIHGAHKDHDVKLIKRAVSEVKHQYLQVMNRIGTAQNNMSKYKDYFLHCIKQSNQRHIREKSIVSHQFELLRSSLASKQKQILKRLEDANKQNIQILTGLLEDININHEQINKVKKSVELVLRKDEVLIFEDYKKIPDFQNKVEFITKQSDSVAGQISILSGQHLQQEMKKIQDEIIHIRQNLRKQIISAEITYSSKGSKKAR